MYLLLDKSYIVVLEFDTNKREREYYFAILHTDLNTMISVDLLRKGLAITSVLGGASKLALPGSNVSD